MIVVYLILLAVIQAVTEFLPVSSMGHLCILEQYMGISHETGLLPEAILHLGTAAAIIFLFRKDLKKIGLGLLGMFMDILGNLNLYIHNKRTGARTGLCEDSDGNISEAWRIACGFHDPYGTSGTYRKTPGSSVSRIADRAGNRFFAYGYISSGDRSGQTGW